MSERLNLAVISNELRRQSLREAPFVNRSSTKAPEKLLLNEDEEDKMEDSVSPRVTKPMKIVGSPTANVAGPQEEESGGFSNIIDSVKL
jgi:hypothetical protein